MDPQELEVGEEHYWDNPDGPITEVEIKGYNGANVLVYYESEAHPDGVFWRVNPNQLQPDYPD